MIKTIIFDIGGVITNYDFDTLYSNFAERLGVPTKFITEYIDKNIDDIFCGKNNWKDFENEIIKVGADSKLDIKKIWIEEGLKSVSVNKELLQIIEKLSKKYSTGILSNVSEARAFIDKKLKLYDKVNYRVLSYEEFVQKPDPAFYKKALSIAHVKPNEAVFIDDTKELIFAAKKIGINGIVYLNNNDLIENLRKLGVEI